MAQYRASHGSRPGADEARTLFRQPLPSRVARHVQLLDQGVLAIATDGPATAGPVHLVPYVNGRGDVLWQCRGDRPPRQLPSGCTTTR